jgi:hypothetical protein
MRKMHLKVSGVDCRDQGQTQYEFDHQAACGYVRENVTRHAVLVDCKLCLREMMKAKTGKRQ